MNKIYSIINKLNNNLFKDYYNKKIKYDKIEKDFQLELSLLFLNMHICF